MAAMAQPWLSSRSSNSSGDKGLLWERREQAEKHWLSMPGTSFSRCHCLHAASCPLPVWQRGVGVPEDPQNRGREGAGTAPTLLGGCGPCPALLTFLGLTSLLLFALQRLANAAEKFQKAHHWQDNIRVRLFASWPLPPSSLLVLSSMEAPALGIIPGRGIRSSSHPCSHPSLHPSLLARVLGSIRSDRWLCHTAQHADCPSTTACHC